MKTRMIATVLAVIATSSIVMAIEVDRVFDGNRGPGWKAGMDLSGAVGLNHVAELTEGGWMVHEKETGKVLQHMTLREFWNRVDAGKEAEKGAGFDPQDNCNDPKLLYDPMTDRWIALVAGTGKKTKTYLAVSATGDPTGAWNGVTLPVDPLDPGVKVGFDRYGLYVVAHNGGDNLHTSGNCYVIPKTDLVAAGGPVLANLQVFENLEYPIAVAVDPDTNKPMNAGQALLSFDCYSGPTCDHFFMYIITWDNGKAKITEKQTVTLSKTYLTPNAQSHEMDCTQPAPGIKLRADGGRRTENLFAYKGSVFAANSVKVAKEGKVGILWYEISVSDGKVIREEYIDDPVRDYLFPSLVVDGNGNIGIGCTGTSEKEYPSIYVMEPMQPGVCALKGTTYYRYPGLQAVNWANYSSACLDPCDAGLLWVLQGYSASETEKQWCSGWVAFRVQTVIQSLAQWQPAGNKIKTSWAEQIDPAKVWQEYPRPVMERPDWQNLNGLWEYAIAPAGQNEPMQFTGHILVPFAIESSLSGVQKRISDKEALWYKKTFTVPAGWKDRDILLHFGAVDWKAEVFINDIKIGVHTGGYTPFCFNITPFLKTGEQKLVVKVFDPTDKGYQPHGKQLSEPRGIWYTPVTGIWQTVWIEPVNEQHISELRITPDIDNNKILVDVVCDNTSSSNSIEVTIFDGATFIASGKAAAGQSIDLFIPNAKLWSPETPFLYDMTINLYLNGKLKDKVTSYCGMRKISTKRDPNGIVRMQLNNRDYIHFGPLDQGWWPDGLYTAPCDEALKYDIQKSKDFGFNMIRKHVKVEPARWYTHCDRMGILVWQDMPSGDRNRAFPWQIRNYYEGAEQNRSPESEANFRKEWKEIMDYLYNYPAIVVWTPFNESWGQFKTNELSEWTKVYDPSRLVNPASGGNHFHTGDILDLHNYPAPELFLYDAERATVLGEYGGIARVVEGHLWQPEGRNFGYVEFNNAEDATGEYLKYAEILRKLIKSGFSAAVYTQTTDVEGEVNGLMTYDRKIIKFEEEKLKKINMEICRLLPVE